MNRRSFFSALYGLPFVGAVFAPKAPVEAGVIRMLKLRVERMQSAISTHIVYGTWGRTPEQVAKTFQKLNDRIIELEEENDDLHATLEVIEKRDPKIYGYEVDGNDNLWEVTVPEHMIEIQAKRIAELEAMLPAEPNSRVSL